MESLMESLMDLFWVEYGGNDDFIFYTYGKSFTFSGKIVKYAN